MPNNPENSRTVTTHRSKKVVAAASLMAGLSFVGVHPNRASAQKTPEPTLAGYTADIAIAPIHGHTDKSQDWEQTLAGEQVPQQAQEFINRNTVYLKALNCSGAIIRNPKGVAVGTLTASHCGLRNADELLQEAAYFTPWITSANGATYILKSGGVQAEAGSNMTSLKNIGDISQFILPPKDSNNIDQALGVLSGHTAQEVIDSYEKEQLSQKEINSFVPGKTTIWMAGWPRVQNGDNNGNKIRRQFAMTYIGQNVFTNAAGERINLVMATIRQDKDGAVCSEGASGSEGFILQKHSNKGSVTSKVRSVGVLSGAWALTGVGDPQQLRQNLEYFKYKYPWANWDGVDAVCGFSNMSLGKNYKVVNVASELEAIPSPQVTSTLIAETLFFNPEYTPTIVNGFVSEKTQSNDNGGEASKQTVIEKPVIFINNDSSVVIGYYDQGGLAIKIHPDLSELQFYQSDSSTPLGTINTKSLKFNDPTDTGTPNLGSFEDSTGLKFGIFDTEPLIISGQAYKVAVVNGHINFIPTPS